MFRETYHHGQTREALVQAAVELVARHGAGGFSLRQAAARVGVDPAGVYRHFRDRAALLAAVAEEGCARLAAAMTRAAAGKRAPRKVIAAMADAYVAFAAACGAHFEIMSSPAARAAAAHAGAVRALFLDALRAWGDAEGLDLHVPRAAQLVHATVHGLALLATRGTREAVADAVETVLAGLAARAAHRGR